MGMYSTRLFFFLKKSLFISLFSKADGVFFQKHKNQKKKANSRNQMKPKILFFTSESRVYSFFLIVINTSLV
jgi:hypothetical protein